MDNIFTMVGLSICFICNVVMLFLNERGKLDKRNSKRIILFLIIGFVLCVIGVVTSVLGLNIAIVLYKTSLSPR